MTYELPARMPRRRPEAPRETITASLPELVAVAVENERTRLLNELRSAVDRVPVKERDKSVQYYDEKDRSAEKHKAAVLAIIDAAYR